ncbi:MBL fold metallo-hydrolase RNA specificity domain-containing protein [Sandarakinorhabdus oryzae]|uniref:MBL fold metallo-hydrolase RNA specificity domain-containing protein n=1 Tax=Sandarakinorhabdus oryzae TaxID=2675220 RepID=UPI0012E2A684|nr:MBL fold metallo-hydrolase [Sandarakinorhabdus oryzae]
MSISLTFHGAARTVTGSCLELVAGGHRILIDCGLFQGSRTLEGLNHAPPPFATQGLDAVILTHAHIDHSGQLPRLAALGWQGPIWCTPQTVDLLDPMLADSGRIHEYEAERRNRRRDRAGETPFVPIYTEADALAAAAMARPVALEDWFEAAPGIRARLWNAGHILGAASVEIEAGGVRLLCSGDLGPDNKAFLPDPASARGFDAVVCEATYGGTVRERVNLYERRRRLADEINAAMAEGGNLVIPAFALERTQELLLDIVMLSRAGAIGTTQVFVDSPLANRVTSVYRRHADTLEDTGGHDVFAHPAIHTVESAVESMRLNTLSGAIIIAASGMCEAGRIRHHLAHNLPRRDSTILFVGFQAQGALGRVILEGASRVRMSGRDIAVRARIRHIDSYSAHADQSELLDWIAAAGPIAGTLFLDHGEASAMDALKAEAEARALAAEVVTPEMGDAFRLEPGKPARRARRGTRSQREAVGRDWQNDYADLASGLKQRLAAIRDDHARQQAIARMRRILDDYEKRPRRR